MLDHARLRAAFETARDRLLVERVAGGHWVGELASSACSTATAVSALALVERHGDSSDSARRLIAAGVEWLLRSQLADGGWGDTLLSRENIATTMLAVAALKLAGEDKDGEFREPLPELRELVPAYRNAIARGEDAIRRQGGLDGLRRRYGKDKTFAVPILTNAALAGMVDWNEVSPLPFEAACLPQSWYRFARLPVVSYAIPALVAIGQARFFHRPPRLWPLRMLRKASIARSLSVLEKMQPASGGYLEATPLTSFVLMSLASTGRALHPVAKLAVKFLLDSARPDGSWPIDTNLATWNTTLAINALAAGGEDVGRLACWDWLLGCQQQGVHPFTGAAPGGWGWTDLSGSVPDADDTPGALLALAALRDSPNCDAATKRRLTKAATAGVRWLLNLQNGDGGWPTFCRGWGTLPFDRSGADLTAHALRALHRWRGLRFYERLDIAFEAGFRYLDRQQQADGSWLPLWFGNQDHPREDNPVYGTAKVLLAYAECGRLNASVAQRGIEWLCENQLADGGWGSVEETALAVETLATIAESERRPGTNESLARGAAWLCDAVESGRWLTPAPIGFYFAKLWYFECLYPQIFTVAALGRLREIDGQPSGLQGQAGCPSHGQFP